MYQAAAIGGQEASLVLCYEVNTIE